MEQKQSWSKIAKNWETYIPPGRPSKQDCILYDEVIKKTIKGISNSKVLVLGATPEIRSFLSKYSLEQGTQVFLIDINKDMVEAMSLLVDFPNNKETVVIKSWLDMDFEENFFDIVIGDLVVTNVALEDKPRLLEKIEKILKPEGRFLTRTRVFDKDLEQHTDLAEVLKEYTEKYRKLELNLKQLLFYFFEELAYRSYYLNNKREYGLKYLTDDLEKLRENTVNPLEKAVLEKFYSDYESHSEKVWVVFHRDEDKALFEKFFEIEDVLFSTDHPFSKFFPIYILKKNN